MRQRVTLEVAFAEAAALRAFLAELAGAGVERDQIEVRSAFPLDNLENAPPRRRSLVLPAALLGGLAGGVAAFLLASLTAQAYPLVTGGLPIVAGPPVAIVTYEGTALGVILATVAAVLLQGRLLRRSRAGALDHHLAEGLMVVSLLEVDGAPLDRARAQAARTAVAVHWEGEPPEAGS